MGLQTILIREFLSKRKTTNKPGRFSEPGRKEQGEERPGKPEQETATERL